MLGNRILKFDELPSTNNYIAKALIDGTYLPYDVILAANQTEGRGQRGNTWQSLPNQNLMFSFAFRAPQLGERQHFLISKAISLGVFRYLSKTLQSDIKIKWPNDILVNSRKICGLLLEAQGSKAQRWFIVGIGLNVNQLAWGGLNSATSIAAELGTSRDQDLILRGVLAELERMLDLLMAGSYPLIQQEYLEALYGCGQWVKFEDAHRSYYGQVRMVDDEGVLTAKSKAGALHHYCGQEVKIRY